LHRFDTIYKGTRQRRKKQKKGMKKGKGREKKGRRKEKERREDEGNGLRMVIIIVNKLNYVRPSYFSIYNFVSKFCMFHNLALNG
jgi:hypothetical protein